nr:hypothetical protein [Tanacetum cinerariifolium]
MKGFEKGFVKEVLTLFKKDKSIVCEDEDEDEVVDNEEEEVDGVNDNEDEAEVIIAYEEFGQNFHVGESLFAGALLEGNIKVRTSSSIGCNLEGVRMVVIRLDKQMLDSKRE